MHKNARVGLIFALCFIALYTAATFAAARALDVPAKFQPLGYMATWVQGVKIVALLGLISAGVSALFSKSPWARFRQLVTTPDLWFGTALFLTVTLFIGVFISAKNLFVDISAFHFDRQFAEWDVALFGQDAWLYFQPLMKPAILNVVDILYEIGWTSALVGVTWVALCRHDRTLYLWAFLLCWTLLGTATALAGMSAGPAFYEALTGDDRYRPLVEFVGLRGHVVGSASWLQNLLWTWYERDGISGISAFPSMHVSMAVLFALYGFRIHRSIGWCLVGFAVFTWMASVYLAWHYAVDGLISVAGTWIIWRSCEAVDSGSWSKIRVETGRLVTVSGAPGAD